MTPIRPSLIPGVIPGVIPGRAYEVRCCCQPNKLLGWYIWPTERPIAAVVARRPASIAVGPAAATETTAALDVHQIELRTFHTRFGSELAVYSEDRPIEFWRTLPGFRENESEGTQ